LNLIIDIGNTFIKFALFQEQTLLVKGKGDLSDLKSFLDNNTFENVIISSVVEGNEVKKMIDSYSVKKMIELSNETKIPIDNKYKTPQTLGDDRLANVIGARSLFPKKNVLVIDVGTCIKFDAISSKAQYFGGAISPGLVMRFKALEYFTGKLPLVEPKNGIELIGDSSDNSILSGVVNGTVAEIEGVINQYSQVYENLTVIFTGGDASFFDKELKSNIFVEQNLTLIGLNEILLYNTRA
jgi:type III pantothenate kinase